MDLFNIQRFYGDEDKLGREDVSLEKERLEKLKEKMKRKRKEFQDDIIPRRKERAKKGLEMAVNDASDILRAKMIDKEQSNNVKQMNQALRNKRKKKDSNVIDDLVHKHKGKTEGIKVQGKRPSTGDEKCKEKRKKKIKTRVEEMKTVIPLSQHVTLGNEDGTEHNKFDVNFAGMSNATGPGGNEVVKFSADDKDRNLEITEPFGNTESKTLDNVETGILKQKETDGYFKVLGSFNRKKEKAVVKRLLPKWIAEAEYIACDVDTAKLSIKDASFLEEFSINNLTNHNIEYLFPVQSHVIPKILSQNSRCGVYHRAGLLPSDICVSAPTGSGKTLAYVIPIIQILTRCDWRRLQAIVILPSRDLALQVKSVISIYSNGTHVKAGLAAGIKSFHDEQQQLVSKGCHGYVSNIDILVCTPGRLVDHIDSTDGFSLEYLRFLVIDEADRLLSQSYHNWLEKIFDAVYKSSSRTSLNSRGMSSPSSTSIYNSIQFPSMVKSIQLPMQKFLFSATMTHNPEKLAPLKLYKPVLCTAVGKLPCKEQEDFAGTTGNDRYILPESLDQKITVCKQSEKPLVVIYLMKMPEYRRVLCFTGSIESTHRLSLLVREFGITTAEFSSTLNQTQRKGVLRDFKRGQIDLLICSDSMARGMDIENVDFVISYDPALNMKTYVHRVGRTARAGNKGTALTLLSPKEVYHFKKMLVDHANAGGLHKMNISQKELAPLLDEYGKALGSLKNSIENEKK